VNEGQQSRQFIHLVPGKEYDVSVWGKTCGNGQIANLKSSLLSDKIVIPPESPANARFKSRDSNEIEICFKGPAEGYFTGFDFLWENGAGETGYQYLQVNDEGTFHFLQIIYFFPKIFQNAVCRECFVVPTSNSNV